MSPALVPVVGAICPKAGSNGLPKYHVSCRPEGDVHTQGRGRTEENRHARFISDTTEIELLWTKLQFPLNSMHWSITLVLEDLQQWVCVCAVPFSLPLMIACAALLLITCTM